MPGITDRLEARAGSYVSRLAAVFPPLGDRILACDDPYAHRVGYRLARNRAGSVDAADWSEFAGDPTAGRWPISYQKVGVVLGRVGILDEVLEQNPALRRAVGWTYKDSILAGIIPYRRYERLHLTDDQFEVGMRVGRETLRAAMGVYDTVRHEFSVPDHASSTGPTYEAVSHAPAGLLIL